MNKLAVTHSRKLSGALARAGAVAAATAFLSLVALVSPAAANTPSGWETVEDVSLLDGLLVMVVYPAVAALLIAGLAVLPSLARRKASD